MGQFDDDTETKDSKSQRKEKAPTGDAASHYLVLADGRVIGHQVGDDPYAPFPTEYDGSTVVQVRNAR